MASYVSMVRGQKQAVGFKVWRYKEKGPKMICQGLYSITVYFPKASEWLIKGYRQTERKSELKTKQNKTKCGKEQIASGIGRHVAVLILSCGNKKNH